jgi:iron-sulfur cluster assembly protein
MALDEPKENDTIFMEQDINFAIDKDLLEKAKPIRLDFVEAGGQSGFKLTSSLPEEGGGGSCCS